jgi:hypothetical protein
MGQRRAISWLLPIVGLWFVASELQRLLAAGSGADAVWLIVTVAFGLAFVARLVFLGIAYFRSR